jgi:hypothetical protein
MQEIAMRHLVLPLAVLVALLACAAWYFAAAGSGEAPDKPAAPGKPAAGHRYPDFGFMPPARQYVGRVFQLSQDYPAKLPGLTPEVCTRDFDEIKQGWRQYLLDVRTYCFEGNVGAADVEDDWRVENNQKRHWYHMPWQHYGPSGREGIHGLTKEAPVQVRQLAWSQTYSGGQTYAVGFYNEFGGYTIGQVWKDHEHPAPRDLKIEFPVGTVVCKVLFVDVPTDQVPFLNPPLTWQGYITDNYQSTNRRIRPLALIQMDVMVRHQGAPTGWVFGTFQYNGRRKGAGTGASWDNLVPLGLQWGNDSDVTADASNPQPVKTVINKELKETVINPDADELPPTHLGWNGRLNGPVDNPMSSCISCHMTAETPQRSEISPLFTTSPPAPGSKEWMRWFQTPRCGTTFDKRSRTTDSSLQMALAIQNFRSWRNEGSKMRADQYTSRQVRAEVKAPVLPGPHMRVMHDAELDEEVEIRRDYPRQQNR